MAEIILIRRVQGHDIFPEIKKLTSGREVTISSALSNLLRFLDSDGVLRTDCRTYQWLYHYKEGNSVLSKVRQRFWILKGRELVKKCSFQPRHHCGVHEALVKSAKRAIYNVLDKAKIKRKLTETELKTVFAEVTGDQIKNCHQRFSKLARFETPLEWFNHSYTRSGKDGKRIVFNQWQYGRVIKTISDRKG
eukprot:TCALIF_13907-PA protein Name:"Protein of unknown function" AED:0.14 eAED:0.42 QI:10/0/0/1/0/0/4/0/191